MYGLRHKLFACAALSIDKDRCICRCDFPDHFAHILHGCALGHDILKMICSSELSFEICILCQRLVVVQGPSHSNKKLIDLKGLGYIVEGSQFHCLYCCFYRTIGREHYD